MKNLVFNGAPSSIAGELLEDLCGNFSLQSVTAVVGNQSFIPDRASLNLDTFDLLDYHKIIYGIYPHSKNSYIDQEVIDRISPFILNILKMMDRLTPHLVYAFEDRMNMMFEHVRYWDNLLTEKKVDMFISMNYPHEVWDYIVYALCKSRGIDTLFFTQTALDGYVQIVRSIEDNDLRLNQKFQTQVEVSKLPELIERQLNNLTSEKTEAPWYMELQFEELREKRKISFNLLRYCSKLLRFVIQNMDSTKNLFHRANDVLFYRQRFGRAAGKKLLRSYKFLSTEPNFSEKYIYVPLHFQPECTTSPQGGVFVYQELMISMLAKNVPANIKLYVKEHPMQQIHGRNQKLYSRLIALPNVKLIKLEVDSNILIDNCVAVATITGTAAWEALFKEKPALLFGDIFFKYAPGVFRVKTDNDCLIAISAIFDENYISQTQSQLRVYLANVQSYLVRGCVDDFYMNVSNISSADNRKNLANAIVLAIKRPIGE